MNKKNQVILRERERDVVSEGIMEETELLEVQALI